MELFVIGIFKRQRGRMCVCGGGGGGGEGEEGHGFCETIETRGINPIFWLKLHITLNILINS